MSSISLLSPLRGVHCAVLGLGISNLPLIDVLLAEGATVTGRDLKTRESLGPVADELAARGVKLILGEGYMDGLCEQLIFRSPGIRPDVPAIANAVANGAILTSEMELFLARTPTPVFAITGSDGKTTTTNLTYRLLQAQFEQDRSPRRAYMGGNVGTPLFPRLPEMTEDDIAVAELSSFQLMTLPKSPTRALITNITPNHLNWHPDMAEYIAAKCNIYAHGATHLTLSADNEVTAALAQTAPMPVTLFSSRKHRREDLALREGDTAIYTVDALGEETVVYDDGKGTVTPVLKVADIRLPGRHNIENYMAAISLTWGLVAPATIRRLAREFPGVPHRLELVRERDGITYYNSSIDSTPTRTAAALSALKERPIVICGGRDKKTDFAPLADILTSRARAVVLTGEAREKILSALRACPAYDEATLPTVVVPAFDEAVRTAARMAQPGDTVLLSPACTSFDAFKNFEERGECFKDIVNNLS